MEKRSETIGKVNLDLSYYSGSDGYSEGAVEDELLTIVQNEPEESFNDIIARRHTWNVLYHLSDMRGNIADFLPVQKTQKVLEIGAGCGAVTGVLSDKAEHVTCIELSYRRSLINAYRNRNRDNIDIIVGNFEDIEPDLKDEYDYIFLIGVLEYSGEYIHSAEPYLDMLSRLTGHLAQGGEIVAGIENKYGMKYIAGCTEDHTGVFYDGIEGYRDTEKVRTFSKKGIEALAKKAGLRTEFYYPYPDYKLPSVVFSDERLPHPGELSDNIRNFAAPRFVAFDEARAFDEAVREGAFPAVSNSFLVLLSKEDRIESFDVKRTLYSRHSDERDDRYRIRTDIQEDGYHKKYVMKYPKTPAARSHLLGMYDSYLKLSEKLKNSSVRVNRARLVNDRNGDFVGVQFEYLEGKTLDDILTGYMREGRKDAALKVIGQFAAFVRAKRPADLDLIFSNIMITADGAWNITDYEWMEEGADPEFIIYRALRYFRDDNGEVIPEDELYAAAKTDTARKAEFEKKEDELQLKIAGSHVSLRSMYSIFGRGYVTLAQALHGYGELLRPGHAKFYYDTGKGYTEQEMTYYDGRVSDDMRVCFDVPLPEGVKQLRVDPAETSCMVRLTDATVKEAMTNGHVCDKTVFFDTEDPQLIFDLPAGCREFHLEYVIGTMDKEMIADIGGRFTRYETAPKGLLKKPTEKKAYDKVSLLDRAE